MAYYQHWRNVPADAWRWASFSPAEIACRGTGKLRVNEAALDRLQELRERLGRPIVLTSAYRSPEHNRSVGGASASMHLEGRAFDVVMANHDPEAFEAEARACGFNGFGHYPGSNFMHLDDRAVPARWKGTGRNNAWFSPASTTPGFTAPRATGVIEIAKELAPVVSPVLVGGAAVAQGDGPVQWALGAIALAAFVIAATWFFRRTRGGEGA